jgi:pantoate--beta-alanine ligase
MTVRPSGLAATSPVVVGDRVGLARQRVELPGPVAVVMTMGALHDGHIALLRQAKALARSTIATIFVNPLQFGPNEDFDTYPRTREADLAVCAAEGVDLVFAPTSEDVIYSGGRPSVRVDPGPLGDVLEGASRPGFFGGVLTVVLKLLHLVRPDVAVFGEKDYQQLALVRRMVVDLDLPIDVVGVPTVREPDGLALSSRNTYLSPEQRRSAVALSTALRAGSKAGASGATGEGVLRAARTVFDAEPGVELDYLVLTDPRLGSAPKSGEARLLVAAHVGTTRLIDNLAVHLRGS